MKLISALICSICISAAALADAPKPESIERLLVVTEVEKLLEQMWPQIDGMMAQTMEQSLGGRDITPEARELARKLNQKLVAQMKEELSWQSMKSLYVQIYGETFTQEEIEGLISFYESPAGRAFVAKMPVITQKTMVLMQQRMVPMMQRIQQTVDEALAESGANETK